MARHIIIAGGGTGGHLYPGIALAHLLMKHDSALTVSFAGTQRGIEFSVVPREGFELDTLLAGGLLGKKGMDLIKSWIKLPVGVLQALGILMKRKPALVVGVGGYASAPLVLSAWLLRIPILIHEQNVFPGITNRWLGKLARRIAVSFEESQSFFDSGKTVVTGNMIREEFCKMESRRDEQGRFTILVLGGSQGAHSINKAMVEAIGQLGQLKERIHVIHQTGKTDEAFVKEQYERENVSAQVQAFFFDMVEHYARADLVICRAGATTLAEVTAAGKASVLIPYPFAAHNHQEKNARVMESAGASELILDRDVDGGKLADAMRRAIDEPERLRTMSEISHSLGKRDATERVKNLCLELLEGTNA